MSGVDVKIRKKLWDCCQTAYLIGDNGKFKENYLDNEYYKDAGFKQVPEIFVDKNNCNNAGFVAILDIGIVISFRGTRTNSEEIFNSLSIADWENYIKELWHSFWDWVNDAKYLQMDYMGFGRVHCGFYRAISNIADEMIFKVKELKSLYKEDRIFITGHSKGGAMAQLTACKMLGELSEKLTIVSFAAPRVGDGDFKKNFNNKFPNAYRYEAFLDIVPHIPFTEAEKDMAVRMIGGKGNARFAIMHIDKLISMEPYYSAGRYVPISKPHCRYSMIPPSIDNEYGETLDSFTTVMWELINLCYLYSPDFVGWKRLNYSKDSEYSLADVHSYDYETLIKKEGLFTNKWHDETAAKSNFEGLIFPGNHFWKDLMVTFESDKGNPNVHYEISTSTKVIKTDDIALLVNDKKTVEIKDLNYYGSVFVNGNVKGVACGATVTAKLTYDDRAWNLGEI